VCKDPDLTCKDKRPCQRAEDILFHESSNIFTLGGLTDIYDEKVKRVNAVI